MNAVTPTIAQSGSFTTSHRGDRLFLVAILLFIWTGILMGFGPGALKQFGGEAAARPFHLHLHAVAFFGWLVLLTVQFALIQSRQWRLHRLLGVGGIGLAVIMIGVGLVTTIESVPGRVARESNPGFVIVPFVDMILFAGLVTVAMLKRKDRAAHPRLIVLATLQLTGAGFGRWLGPTFGPMFADLGIVGGWIALYGMVTLGIVAMGVYDLATRGRLHRIYLPALTCMLAGQVTAMLLIKNDAWVGLVTRLFGS